MAKLPTREEMDNNWDHYRNRFADNEGNMVSFDEDPPAAEVFWILCGPWPNSKPDIRRATCKGCLSFVGISPRGWRLHRANLERALLCRDCYDLLISLGEKDVH